ncbi:Heterokaryon incompatibility protein S [Lasiodiplodia hormozganensis]|uniref:Heterokaryon incompatibility protein S n=1 Tax=Lasiodiplodia hormozganensis TaxID=869390 RepID=A0AA39Y5P6_9PEZI|nr:Heterokaryon incompatibility protein S [Lasiodiplodia hormozganensis]
MEAVGLGIGALGLAGLFNNAVDCFEFVQLGRDFGKDFGTSQLQLDNTRLRLTRWGEAVHVQENEGSLPPAELEQAKKTIGQILFLFAQAEGVSEDVKRKAGSATELAAYDPNSDMEDRLMPLHEHMRSIAQARQKKVGLRRKTKWALYGRGHFMALLENIRALLDDLEKMVPARRDAQRSLCEEEVSIMNGNVDLPLLESVAADQDPDLREAVKKVLDKKEERPPNVIFSGADNRGFQLGHNSGSISGFTFG